MKLYDYLIVGAGLYGACFAYFAKKQGKKCLVIDKRPHTGGNLFCENIEGINVHKYGAHIFHTSNKKVWDFMNSLTEFNNYINSPIANYRGKLYNLPFNMNTFYQLWGVVTPKQAKDKIKEQRKHNGKGLPQNLEEQAISLVGTDIYNTLIKGYTQKQWGRECKDLPASIISRLPVRFTYNNNYFNDIYQGIPIGGYNLIFNKLLDGIEVRLNCDYFEDKDEYNSIAERIVYTGPIDRFYDYKFGKLSYRTVRFEHEIIDTENYQGVAVMNYTDIDTPYTRIIEHKHFDYVNTSKTVISKEFSSEWTDNSEPYYPINDDYNNDIYHEYKLLAQKEPNIIFGGRLAEYKYYDMHHIVELVMNRPEFDN